MSYPFIAHSHRQRLRPWRRSAQRPRLLPLLLAVAAAFTVRVETARAEPPRTELPQGMTVGSGTASYNTSDNLGTITQQSQKAILNWQSFNIGRDAHVHFDHQMGAASATLNRIAGGRPSEIFGKLSADGTIYLINRNGVVFGSGAQVNVRGLVASSLDISDQLFLDGFQPKDVGTAVFVWNDDQASFETALAGGNGVVRLEAGAVIKTDSGGTVMLLAPRVENAGRIETPEGQTILAAGAKVYLDFSEDPSLRGFLVEVDPFKDAQGKLLETGKGEVTNLGEIIAERGNVTMAAYAVKQLGRISATTSVRLNGSVILKARDGATTAPGTTERIDTQVLNGADRFGELVLGEDSRIEITPDSSSETSTDTQTFNSSYVELSGKHIDIQRGAHVIATGGEIVIATERQGLMADSKFDGTPDDSRIYLDTDAVLDVSGTQHYAVPLERNFVPIRLLGDELKDSPNNQDGYLYRKEVWVDLRRKPPLISNIDGHIAQVGRTAGERTTAGGTVKFLSRGEVILREGSNIDVSGGSLRYLDGYGRTTQLVAQGRVYDISDAPADIAYTGIAGIYTVKTRWGEREWIVPGLGSSSRNLQGYVEGKDAGKIEIVASAAALAGTLRGAVTSGPYQRDAATLPKSGQLVIGNAGTDVDAPDYRMQAMRIVRERVRLPPDFWFETALPQTWRQEFSLSTDMLHAGGIGRVGLYSNGKVTLDPGVEMNLGSGGAFTANARQISIEGSIVVPGGTISLKTADIDRIVDPDQDPAEHDLRIAPGAQILTQGQWVNDLPRIAGGEFAPRFIDGGSIDLASVADLSVADGSLLDVSGGAWLDAAGKLKAGKGGAIGLKTGRIGLSDDTDPQQSKLELGGELRGHALDQGGKLTLDTTQVQIGGAPPAGQPTLLRLTPDFFRRGGFRDYTIKGHDGLTVTAGTEIYPLATNFVLHSDAARTRSGSGIYGLSTQTTWPVENRGPGKLTLTANFGNLVIEPGAVLRTDPGGAIGLEARRLTVDGTLDAPAGAITLTGPSWLGKESRLLARGILRRERSNLGSDLQLGEVLGGGTVTIAAGGGYLVTEQGSIIDVSGAQARLDMLPPAGAAAVTRGVDVASDAGAISLSASEGMLLDGALLGKPGGDNARGGELRVRLDPTGDRQGFSDSRVVVRQSGQSVPAGLGPGDVIDIGRFNGKAFVSLDRVVAGGFDSLELAARHRIEFDGNAQLALRRRLVLNAPTIAAGADAHVRLSAPYFSIANARTTEQRNAPAAWNARFEGSGQFIDLKGNVSVSGFGEFDLAAADDIRLLGVGQGANVTEQQPGSLTSDGNVKLRADQIYPATKTDFMLRVVNNSNGIVTILPGDGARPVLSAGGRVTVSAPNIEHQGVLKAPQGEIAFADSDGVTVKNVHVANGAVLSVSGEGMTVPFGTTQIDGSQWIYSYGSGKSVAVKQAPEKRVTLAGEKVRVDSGATINLEGGGDLYAYEFTPGAPGRSKDVLAPENAGSSFAIVPRLKGEYAPYDPQYYAGVGVGGARADGSKYTYLKDYQPGDSIYLSGANGLPAGTYAVLPARYALLDGAWLVTPVSGYRDLQTGTRIARHDGGEIVSGYRVSIAQGGNLRDARTAGFTVRRGDLVRREADYGGSYASRFFDPAASRLPQDAGRLVLAASKALSVEGLLRSAPADGGRGAEVDITADQIAIVGPNAVGIDAGFVTLDAASLTNLNTASLLIGGTRRSGEQGTEIDVTAAKVVVANDTGNSLRGPEVILVANDRVTLNDGAVVEGKGEAALSTADLVIQDNAAALVRVSSGAQVGVIRPATTDTDDRKGKVDIKAGARLTAARSMILDGSTDVTNAGTFAVGDGPGTGALALGASRVSIGDAPADKGGIVLSGANLDALRGLKALTLRAGQGLDVYGGLDIGFNNLSIDAPRIAGYRNAGVAAVLRAAGDITLSNKSNTSAAGTPDGTTGTLKLEAGDAVRLGNGAYGIAGFDKVTLAAGREIRAEGKGSLDVAGALTLEAPRVTAATGSDITIAAASGRDGTNPVWHTLVLQRPALSPATLPAVNALAANLTLLGKNVSIGTDIELPSGILRAEARGADGADHNVTVESGANIKAGGAERAFADVFAYAPGGAVKFVSENGNVMIAAGASVDVAGVGAGDGGRLEISAHKGKANIDGTISGGAGPKAGNDAQSGSFLLDVSTLDDGDPVTTGEFLMLNTKLNDSGFTESRRMRIGSGDIVIGNSDTVQAREVQFIADNGVIDVSGKIDASGVRGGNVELWAAGAVALRNGAEIDASASGTDERGGSVLLATSGAGNAALTLETGSKINVTGTKKTPGGEVDPSGKVHLRAPRVDTDNDGVADSIAVADLDATITGAKRINVEAFSVKTLNAGEGIADTNGFDTTIPVGERDRLVAQLIGANPGLGQQVFHVLPGVEIRTPDTATALDISGTLDLSGLRSADGEPGVLTIRSAGDLNVKGSISDGFTNATVSGKLFADGDSWSYRLAAGADLGSAHVTALDRDSASDFKLAAGKLIRTGTGSIDIAAAGRIVLTDQKSVIYTAGHNAPLVPDVDGVRYFSAPVVGKPPNSVTAVYPTDGGDLRLRAGGDIIAAPSNQLVTDWQYRQGKLAAGGTILSGEWVTWYPRFDKFEQGVGALGGGRVDIAAGGDIRHLSAVTPTSGRLPGEAGMLPDATKLQVFGGGDLFVHAGGDILSGLYYVDRGRATIQADGSIVSGRDVADLPLRTLLALGDASLAVRARGDLDIQTVFNPTLVMQTPDNLGNATLALAKKRSYFSTYGRRSLVDLVAVGGNLTLSATLSRQQLPALNPRWGQYKPGPDVLAFSLYPPVTRAAAIAGNLVVPPGSALIVTPAPQGTLELLAGDSVSFGTAVQMLDHNPRELPHPLLPATNLLALNTTISGWAGARYHSSPPLHESDPEPLRIVAAGGDIVGTGGATADLRLSKPAIIQAGRDIRDLHVVGQNLRPEDVTRIEAGRDIIFTIPQSTGANVPDSDAKIDIGGPGRLEVLAGRDVDLGSSIGIRTRGNLDNPFLPEGGADILVQAGVAGSVDRTAFIERYLADADSVYRAELLAYMRLITGDTSLDEATALAEFHQLPANSQTPLLNTVFFTELRESGKQATDTKSERFGDYSRGIEAVRLMYPGSNGDDAAMASVENNSSPYRGDIKLFFSQVKTEQNGGIDLIAPGGTVNAGLATSSGLDKGTIVGPKDDASYLGVVTAAGGGIRGYVLKDFLVNQSRVFTLQGGDILLWATKGDIDAGRGARVASATPPPRLRVTSDGQVVLDLTQSVAGSGIGALRANPDAPESNVYLFAPEGTVNAGEAGIRVSGNLTIGAQQVLGADIIQAGGVSVGVPTDTGGAAAGLAGVADSAASTSKSAENAATAGSRDDDNQLMLDVEVVSYGGNGKETELRIKKDDKEKDKE